VRSKGEGQFKRFEGSGSHTYVEGLFWMSIVSYGLLGRQGGLGPVLDAGRTALHELMTMNERQSR
jgi:hypothetical protein